MKNEKMRLRRRAGFFVKIGENSEGNIAQHVEWNHRWSVALGVDANTIRRWLRGVLNSPTLDALVPKKCPELMGYKGRVISPSYA